MKRELLSLENHLKNLNRKSKNTMQAHRTAINSFIEFLGDKKLDQPLNILNDYVTYLEDKEKLPNTIINYLACIKKYLRICHGIKIDLDDFKDFVVLPQVVEVELEPLSKDEARLIVEYARGRRRALYWFILSTGCRISEALQIKRENIDFTKDPVQVFSPANIVKGKRASRLSYLTLENTPLIRQICEGLAPGDLIFTDNSNVEAAANNEEGVWITMINNLGLTQRYSHNGRFKKNIHSMQAYVSTMIYDTTRDNDYAHAYIGHSAYLKQYMRKSPEMREKMFLEVEPALRIMAINQPTSDDKDNRIRSILLKQKMLESEVEYLQKMNETKDKIMNN